MYLKYLIISVLTLMLAGCMGSGGVDMSTVTPQQILESSTVTGQSNFDKSLKVKGPVLGNLFNQRFLRGYIRKNTGKVTTLQLYVDVSYTGSWIFYTTASFDDGESINVTVIDREVSSCSGGSCLFNEHVAVNLSKRYLVSKMKSGFQVRFEGRGGRSPMILSVPGNYIEGFLMALRANGGKI